MKLDTITLAFESVHPALTSINPVVHFASSVHQFTLTHFSNFDSNARSYTVSGFSRETEPRGSIYVSTGRSIYFKRLVYAIIRAGN